MCELLFPPNRIPVTDPFIKCEEAELIGNPSQQFLDDSSDFLNFSTDSLDRVIFQIPASQCDSTLEYTDQVCNFMQQMENDTTFSPKSCEKNILSKEERVSVVEWMLCVSIEFGLLDETFFSAVSIFDKMIQSGKCEISEVQLLSATSLWISAKLNETQIPSVEDFVIVCGSAFSADDFCNFEKKILSDLNYNIFQPTTENFTAAFLSQIPADPSFSDVVMLFMYASLYSSDMMHTKSSHNGLAAITLTKILLDYPMNLIVIPRSIPHLDDDELEKATLYLLDAVRAALANTSGPFTSKFADFLQYSYIDVDDLATKVDRYISTKTLSTALES